jgi:hypothetical protein
MVPRFTSNAKYLLPDNLIKGLKVFARVHVLASPLARNNVLWAFLFSSLEF